MVVGILQLEIRLFFSNSLKDKRRIIKSIICRIRKNFNVSISEIGHHNLWRSSQLGIAFLTTQTKFSYQVLNKIIDFLQREKGILIVNSKMEIL